MIRPRCILLDVDGTLIDSNDAHASAWVDAFGEFGQRVKFDEVRRRIGMGGDKLMPEVSGITEDSAQGQGISSRRRQIFLSTYLPRLKPFPHVRELLSRLRNDGLRLVVATSAKRDELDPLLRQAGVDDLIWRETSSDDADESKPDPDIVKAALVRGRCSPGEAVMIGDTPYDVAASTAAGVRIVCVRCGGWDLPELSGAATVFDDPADMLAQYERLTHVFARDRADRVTHPSA
jgi:HAD superfamily hydrolase (TIGR01509 family)